MFRSEGVIGYDVALHESGIKLKKLEAVETVESAISLLILVSITRYFSNSIDTSYTQGRWRRGGRGVHGRPWRQTVNAV